MAAATALTLALPGVALAQSAAATDLEGRIAQLEQMVQALKSELDAQKAATLEFDLFGSTLGNEAATNTYGVTVRHAYATWGNWLAGQTWSNIQHALARRRRTRQQMHVKYNS